MQAGHGIQEGLFGDSRTELALQVAELQQI